MAGGRIIGFATLAPIEGCGELEDLFVDPKWMRRGVGRALIDDAVRMALSQRLSCIEVDANPAALAFYQRMGFAAIGDAILAYGTGVRMRLGIDSE